MADEPLKRKEFPLTGKLITSEDPIIIGSNFRELKNMRYASAHPEGIGGHSKISTTALGEIKNGIHFRKERYGESHVVVEATDIYDNQTAVPNTGDFGSSVYSPSGTDGRFSLAPDGYLAYANGAETCIWGGDESPLGGFINYDPGGAFFYDYTDQANDTTSLVTLNRVSDSPDNSVLQLHLDNNVTDNSPSAHTVTNTNVTFDTTSKFGTHAGVFNGTDAYLTVPDEAGFDLSGGIFSIDMWVRPDNFTANGPLFYQETDVESVAFTLGSAEITAGQTITGSTSGETAIVDYVDVASGTWAGGNAEGTIYVHDASGAFQNEFVTSPAPESGSISISGDFSFHGTNYAKLYINLSGYLKFIVYESYGAGSTVLSLQTPALYASVYQHVELTENGNDWYLFVDGAIKAYTSDTSRLNNYMSTVYIGYDTSDFYDGRIDEYRISDVARHVSGFEVPTAAYSDEVGEKTDTYFYIGTILPTSGFKFYVSTANTSGTTVSIDYWSGSAWESVSSLSDSTFVWVDEQSGPYIVQRKASLAQTGTMTFTSTAAVAAASSINSVFLYWYRVTITTMDDNVSLSQITSRVPFQPIKEIWDGAPNKPLAFYVKRTSNYEDYTGNIREDDYNASDAATYVDIDSLNTTSGASRGLIIGFDQRQTAIRFVIVGDKANTTVNTVATVSYWDGTGWVSVGTIDDKTSENNISFSQGGLISWNAVNESSEFRTEFTGVSKEDASVIGSSAQSPSLYFYKVSFDKVLSGDASSDLLVVYVTGIPAQNSIGGYKFPLMAMDRLWLFSDQEGQKNKSLCSSESTPTVFSGEDSYPLLWGDESEIMAAEWIYSQYGASLYSILIVFKKNEMWALVGTDPSEWIQYKVASIGCVAPKTIKVIDLPTDVSRGTSRSSIIIFQGQNGIYMTDGRPPTLISQDIADLFDKRQSKINQSLVDEAFGFVDKEKMEYHWCFAQGASIDTELVFDYAKMKWFEIERPTTLTAGIEVEDTNGVTYVYGAASGRLLRLENGNTFDGSDITHTLWMGDVPLAGEGSATVETKAEYHNLIAVSKTTANDITVTHYGDTSTTGTAMTMVPRKTGYRTIRTAQHNKPLGYHIFHSWKFELTTNDQTTGFEPLYFSCMYKAERNYTKDYRS